MPLVTTFIESALPPAHNHRDGSPARARQLLRKHPQLPAADIYTAATAGDPRAIVAHLKADRGAASRPGGPRTWQPLSYLCFSMLLRDAAPADRNNFRTAARFLLKAGADPNASFLNLGDNVSESALYGAAGLANDAPLTRLLLAAGAKVDDGESLYHACDFPTLACLRLLLQARPGKKSVSYCMLHKMDTDDVPGLRLFLRYGADPNFLCHMGVGHGFRPLHWAIFRNRAPRIIATLLRAGAKPNMPASDGTTPYAFARVRGQSAIAALLQKHGARTTLTPQQTFLAACADNNEPAARAALAQHPNLLKSLSPMDRALLPAHAAANHLPAVRLLLNFGLPLESPGDWGGTALHQAAWNGHIDVVKFLLQQGASLKTRQHWGGDVLATAQHGAQNAGHKNGKKILTLLHRAARKQPSAAS